MSAFTIGTHNLPAAEVILIKTLIRLFAHSPGFQWRFADAGPFDAIIVDASRAKLLPLAPRARAVLTIAPASAGAQPNTICRPIRAEQLQAWLQSQEPALRQAATPLRVEPKCAPVRGSALRFKLRRWPSAALLGNDLQRIRLATLLSRRALGARELSSISNLPPEQCLAFVDTLRQAGLVEVEEAVPSVGPAAVPHAATAAASRPFGLGSGLIGSLRRRLGL